MPAEIIPPAAQSPRSATILVVEDDADVGDFLREIIDEETPYHTIVVPDGLRALEKAQQLHPCLLLLDFRLPGINGLEVYDRLQEREETRGVPAIMMSAALPIEELQNARGTFRRSRWALTKVATSPGCAVSAMGQSCSPLTSTTAAMSRPRWMTAEIGASVVERASGIERPGGRTEHRALAVGVFPRLSRPIWRKSFAL